MSTYVDEEGIDHQLGPWRLKPPTRPPSKESSRSAASKDQHLKRPSCCDSEAGMSYQAMSHISSNQKISRDGSFISSKGDRGMPTQKAAAMISAAQPSQSFTKDPTSKFTKRNKIANSFPAASRRESAEVALKMFEVSRNSQLSRGRSASQDVTQRQVTIAVGASSSDDGPENFPDGRRLGLHTGTESAPAEAFSPTPSMREGGSGRKTCRPTEFGIGELEVNFVEGAINPLQRLALDTIKNPRFEGFFCCIVFINAITMGLESEFKVLSKTFWYLDLAFLIGYTCEFSLRLFALRGVMFRVAVAANVLDVVIVFAGWSTVFVGMATEAESNDVGNPIGSMNVLKVLRALRVLRCVRMLTFFEGLWFVVQSFFYCLKPLIWVCVFIFVILFIFAMFAVEMIGTSQQFDHVENQYHFARTVTAIVTLFQLMTLDEWRLVIQPFFDEQPWTYLFFFFFIAVGSLALMNLVTAVVVENSMRRIQDDESYRTMMADKDRGVEKEKIQALLKFFRDHNENSDDADATDSGSLEQLTISPFDLLNSRGAWPILDHILEALELDAEEDIGELFTILDADGNGELSLSEVLDGILQLRSIVQDKHKAALIRAFDEDSKFELLARFCEHLPETIAMRLPLIEKKVTDIEESLQKHGISRNEEEEPTQALDSERQFAHRKSNLSEMSSGTSPRSPGPPSDPGSRSPSSPGSPRTPSHEAMTEAAQTSSRAPFNKSMTEPIKKKTKPRKKRRSTLRRSVIEKELRFEGLDGRSSTIQEETSSQALGSERGSASLGGSLLGKSASRWSTGSIASESDVCIRSPGAQVVATDCNPQTLPKIPDELVEQPTTGIENDLLQEFRRLRQDVSRELSVTAGEIRRQDAKLSWQKDAVNTLRSSLHDALGAAPADAKSDTDDESV